MHRYWSGLAVAGMMAGTAVLGAQSQNPVNTPPTDVASPPGVQRVPDSPPSAQTRTGNTVTISGCIQNAPSTTAGNTTGANRDTARNNPDAGAPAGGANTGAQAGAATSSSFVLANASMAGGASNRGAVGTTGSSTASSYQLMGNTAMITPHLNHQVEITGRLQTSSASATGAANAAPGSTAASPTLQVESVKMVSSTCTPASTTTTPGGNSTTPGGSNNPPTTQPAK
jgi:hypothetical protein